MRTSKEPESRNIFLHEISNACKRSLLKGMAARYHHRMSTVTPLSYSPPPSPTEYGSKRKHLSNGVQARPNTEIIRPALKPSDTSYHANLDSEASDYAVIEKVDRVPVTKCLAKEVIYTKDEKLYVTRPVSVSHSFPPSSR